MRSSKSTSAAGGAAAVEAGNPATCQLAEEPSLDIYGSRSVQRERSALEWVGHWAAAPLRLLVPGAELASRLGNRVMLLIICLARVGHFHTPARQAPPAAVLPVQRRPPLLRPAERPHPSPASLGPAAVMSCLVLSCPVLSCPVLF